MSFGLKSASVLKACISCQLFISVSNFTKIFLGMLSNFKVHPNYIVKAHSILILTDLGYSNECLNCKYCKNSNNSLPLSSVIQIFEKRKTALDYIQ